MSRRNNNKKCYKEDSDSDDSSLYHEIQYFSVAKDVIIDIGDGWSPSLLSFPQHDYKHGFLVNCIVSKQYHRLMTLEFILSQADIVKAYVKYIQKHYAIIEISFKNNLKQAIEAAKTLVTSPFKKHDILLYLDPPPIVISNNGELLMVTKTFKITEFKCLADYALVTEVKHLDASLTNPNLASHPICKQKGTLQKFALKLLITSKEIKTIGEVAAKYKAVALVNAAKLEEVRERYKNRVKVSEQNVKGVFQWFTKNIKQTMKLSNVGIVTTPKYPLSYSGWKYEVKRHLTGEMEFNQWKIGKHIDYHNMTLLQLQQLTSSRAVKQEIVTKDNNNKAITRILTWEGARVAYDKQGKYMFMKLNLVRIDPVNKIVIGSYKQKLHQKYMQRKRNKKNKIDKDESNGQNDSNMNID